MYVHIYGYLLIIKQSIKKLFITEIRASEKATIKRFYCFNHLLISITFTRSIYRMH